VSEQLQLFLIIAPMVLALAFGIWVGLGYPGLYGKYDSPHHPSHRSPADIFSDWVVRILDGRPKKETDEPR
jgi:hypothetical protein